MKGERGQGAMRKMKRLISSSILTALIVTNILAPSTVSATTNLDKETVQIEQTEETTENLKTNFNFINTTDLDNIQYTYEENGKTYLVNESANSDLTVVETEIYEVGEESNVLVENFTTYIEKSDTELVISKYVDDFLVDSSSIDLNSQSLKFNEKSIINEDTTNTITATGTYNGQIYYDASTGRYYTSWYYDHSTTGSSTITKFTLTVVIGILSGISGNPYVVGGITTAAQYIVDYLIEDIWWSQDIYFVHRITSDRKYYGSAVGIRYYTSFYSNRQRTSYIGSDVYEWHDSTEWPTNIIIN